MMGIVLGRDIERAATALAANPGETILCEQRRRVKLGDSFVGYVRLTDGDLNLPEMSAAAPA
jgi:hypothetical protein